MIQIDAKFIGKYINESIYLAILISSMLILSSPILLMISLFVERLPVRAPVEQEVRKNVKSTTHLYL